MQKSCAHIQKRIRGGNDGEHKGELRQIFRITCTSRHGVTMTATETDSHATATDSHATETDSHVSETSFFHPPLLHTFFFFLVCEYISSACE